MTPDSALAAHSRMMDDSITIRRYFGTGQNRPRTDYTARARVMGYKPDMLTGSVQQGDRKVIILASDLNTSQFPGPITVTDKILVRGKELSILAVDDNTRRLGGTLIAYELQVRG